MNVSLRQLRAFVAVARYGSFTLAADSLYITQSALSGLMRDLEQALQVRLVDRSTRRIRLTDVGSQLFPLVQKILDDLDTVMAEVGKLKDLERGLVRVAVPQLLASTWLPPMLAGFRQQHPQIELRLLDSTVETVVSRVFAGEVDFGIGPEREPNSDIEATLLFEVPFLAALPAGHALAARAKLRWEDLIAEELITLQGQFTERLSQDLRATWRGLGLKPAHEVSFMATALKMVAAGLGVTVCLPYAAELVEQQGLKLRPLQEPVIRRGVYLFTRKGRTLSPAAEAMLAHLREAIAQQMAQLQQRGWL